MPVIADNISTNTYYFQSSMGDDFNPNSEPKNDIFSVPFLHGRQTANDINIGGFQVIAGGYRDDQGGNTDQGYDGVRVPVSGIYFASFNMVMHNNGSWSTTRFRNACMFTVQDLETQYNNVILPFHSVKSAMAYIRNASGHTQSSNIQQRLLKLNQGDVVGLACQALGGNAGTTHIYGDRCNFTLARLF